MRLRMIALVCVVIATAWLSTSQPLSAQYILPTHNAACRPQAAYRPAVQFSCSTRGDEGRGLDPFGPYFDGVSGMPFRNTTNRFGRVQEVGPGQPWQLQRGYGLGLSIFESSCQPGCGYQPHYGDQPSDGYPPSWGAMHFDQRYRHPIQYSLDPQPIGGCQCSGQAGYVPNYDLSASSQQIFHGPIAGPEFFEQGNVAPVRYDSGYRNDSGCRSCGGSIYWPAPFTACMPARDLDPFDRIPGTPDRAQLFSGNAMRQFYSPLSDVHLLPKVRCDNGYEGPYADRRGRVPAMPYGTAQAAPTGSSHPAPTLQTRAWSGQTQQSATRPSFGAAGGMRGPFH